MSLKAKFSVSSICVEFTTVSGSEVILSTNPPMPEATHVFTSLEFVRHWKRIHYHTERLVPRQFFIRQAMAIYLKTKNYVDHHNVTESILSQFKDWKEFTLCLNLLPSTMATLDLILCLNKMPEFLLAVHRKSVEGVTSPSFDDVVNAVNAMCVWLCMGLEVADRMIKTFLDDMPASIAMKESEQRYLTVATK